MTRWRKKPVEVDAVRFDGFDSCGAAMFENGLNGRPAWVVIALIAQPGEAGAMWPEPDYHPPVLLVGTLEGPLRAEPGDWIVRGTVGELYPVKPEVFRETYERVEA